MSIALRARFAAAADNPLRRRQPLTGSSYDQWAARYDMLNGGHESALPRLFGLEQLRREAALAARGDVLEIGMGTGLTLPLYSERMHPLHHASPGSLATGAIHRVVGIDASAGMLREARRRRQALPKAQRDRVTLLQADASERLPFEDASFDVAVMLYVLSVADDPGQILRESLRVLRPGGHIVVADHVRSYVPLVAAYQNVTADAVRALSKGSRWNLDLERLLHVAAGDQIYVASRKRILGGTVELIIARSCLRPQPAPASPLARL